MELQDFIKQSLVQIVSGIAAAQKELADKGAWVNPSGLRLKPGQIKGHSISNDGNVTQNIEFDVAVTSTEGSEKKGGVGVVAALFAVGVQGQSSESFKAISRLRFTVPVLFPDMPRSDEEDQRRNYRENMDKLISKMA